MGWREERGLRLRALHFLLLQRPLNYQVSCGLGGFGALHHKPSNKITDEKECINIAHDEVYRLILITRQSFCSWLEPQKPFCSFDKWGSCRPGMGCGLLPTLHSVTAEPGGSHRGSEAVLFLLCSFCCLVARLRSSAVDWARSACLGCLASSARPPNTCLTK